MKNETPGVPPTDFSDYRNDANLLPLALPRWFDEGMLALLLPDLSAEQRSAELDRMLDLGEVEFGPGRTYERYRVPPRLRTDLLRDWMSNPNQARFRELSRELARYCGTTADTATSATARDEWRIEQIYHLAAAEPERAMRMMRTRFDEALGENFDVNGAYRWLAPLEDRRDWLQKLERQHPGKPGWTAELARLRESVAARAFWTEEWYRTLNYLPRETLPAMLNAFFAGDSPHWAINLHAPGGHGKTITVEWLLTRYALPKGYICARVDFETFSPAELLECAEQPDLLLNKITHNLNGQRAQKLAALERPLNQRGDPVGSFALLLREVYDGQIVVIFLDTLDTLLAEAPQPGATLENLLAMFRRIREGESAPGYPNLRLVISGRNALARRFDGELRRAFAVKSKRARLGLLEVELEGFSRQEASDYLTQKRKLSGRAKRLIEPIVERAAADGVISPLELALYADLVKQDKDLTPEKLRQGEDTLSTLTDRIIRQIEDPAVHWLTRYGVIFRRLDARAAKLLLAYLEKVMAVNGSLDEPDLPPDLLTFETSLDWQIPPLLEQLTRLSWLERQGDYIVYHPNVADAQLELIQAQPIFRTLQNAAFRYYARLAEQAAEPQRKAAFLREALYHSAQMENTLLDFWREQFNRYRNAGVVLWALVDEIGRLSDIFKVKLPKADACRANLALANVLLAEKDRPFLPDQLQRAEDAAKTALSLAEKADEYETNLTAAKVALARRKLSEALDLAHRALNNVKTAQERVEAMQLLGQIEAANSMWGRALGTLRNAYRHSVEMLSGTLSPVSVQLELVENLLPGENWREAIELLEKARRELPGDPTVLEYSARLELRRGRLEDAYNYCRLAALRSAGSQAARLAALQDTITLYQGQNREPKARDINTAVLETAARADWTGMESLLRTRLANTADGETLEVINLLLQFYLEISGDWRQVRALLERGTKLAENRARGDLAVARLSVMAQYMEFMSNPPRFDPAFARRDCERRLRQVAELQTPEERVRAKGYLLLVRFYADLKPGNAPAEQEAARIYADCARQALERVFELLLKLAPQDQVDIMRTLATLPGWSSALVNDYGLDPAERSPMLLLAEMTAPPREGTFLQRLLTQTGLKLDGQIETLRQQVTASMADWALYYMSFARLLAQLGQPEAARELLEHPAVVAAAENLPVIHDRAFLLDWDAARELLESTIARLEEEPATSSLVNELMLTWAYLALRNGQGSNLLESVAVWLSRLFALRFLSPGNRVFLQDYFTLEIVVNLRLGLTDKVSYNLRQAIETAESLGNTYALTIFRRVPMLTPALPPAGSAATPIAPAREPELCLVIQMLDAANANVTLSRGNQTLFERQTNLANVKKLLPQSQNKISPGLPDLDYWQKLLSRDFARDVTIERVGDALLNDILPPRSKGRKILQEYYTVREMPVLRVAVQGRELEQIPWGILHDANDGWISRRTSMTRNNPPFEYTLRGTAIAVRPLPTRPDPYSILRQLEGLYRPRTDKLGQPPSARMISADFFERLQPNVPSLSQGVPALPTELKLLHLIGDMRELPETGLPYLSMGQTRRAFQREHLTADALAHQLRQIGVGRTLIIIEPLSTGSAFEDGRSLMLRNAYAGQLARLGNWLVLAYGPRRGASDLINRLVQSETITTAQLEGWLREVRAAVLPSEPGRLSESQFALFYPAD
jgi:tetratricopeptide (TPR) repeat protein